MLEPSSAEPGGSAAHPAAAGAAGAQRARQESETATERGAQSRDPRCSAAPFPDRPPALGFVAVVRTARNPGPRGARHLRVLAEGESGSSRSFFPRRLGLRVANFSNSDG